VGPELLAKQERFALHKQNSHYRDCPNPSCPATLLGDPLRPAMTCPQCHTAFCFYHATAHPGLTCQQHARRVGRSERASQAAVRRTTRPCPRCGVRVEKMPGGCNHMFCEQCRHHWCWLCGGEWTPIHFSNTNWRDGCPGAQFLSFDVGCYRCCVTGLRGLWLPGRALLVLLTIPVALAVQALIAVFSLVWLVPGVLMLLAGRGKGPPLATVFPAYWRLLTPPHPEGCYGALSDHVRQTTKPAMITIGVVILLVVQLAWMPVALLLYLPFALYLRCSGAMTEAFTFGGYLQSVVFFAQLVLFDVHSDDD
jgi:hypothetical protein